MNLADSVVPFAMSTGQRLYYLRGVNFYEQDIPSINLPYNFDANFKANYGNKAAETIFGMVALNFAGNTQSWTRAQWCSYFANGQVPQNAATPTFPSGTPIRDIGYWNLLYDQLGDEGFDYVTDANGFSSNTINWNSADAMQNNTEFGDGSVYSRIQGGYGLLFEALANQVAQLAQDQQTANPFFFQTRLTGFEHDASTDEFTLKVTGNASGAPTTCDYLFLAMPRRSLELVAAGSSAANVLNQAPVKLYIEAAMNQPAFKVALLFDEAWWSDTQICSYPPNLQSGAGGPTMTDLPLRQIVISATMPRARRGAGLMSSSPATTTCSSKASGRRWRFPAIAPWHLRWTISRSTDRPRSTSQDPW